METKNGNKNGASGNGYVYTFGPYTVDPANRTFSRDGDNLQIPSKVYDVLLAFVENPGRLMTKDELIERVWTDEFVEEGNLARNVSTLRKALGDTEKQHRYIATVPGHGYRFISDVTVHAVAELNGQHLATGEAIENAASEVETARTQSNFFDTLYSRPVFLLVIGACLLVGVLLAFSLSKRPLTLADTLSFDRLHQSTLTQDGNVFEPLISPDGKYLAYVRLDGNYHALCLRQLSTGSVLELRPPEPYVNYWAVAFSPDNEFLYYILREEDLNSGSLFRIPLIGQQIPTKIADHANGGLAISPDGQTAAFTRDDRDAGRSYIVTVSTTGENERVVDSTDLDSTYFSLDWSPDGQSLLYSKKRPAGSQTSYLNEIPSTGGSEAKTIAAMPNAILMAKWLSDRSGIIVNAIDEVTNKPQIFAMSYPDGTLRRVTQDQNSYVGFSIAADGKTIVVPRINSSRQIWSIGEPQSVTTQVSAGTEKHFDNIVWQGDENLVFDEDENGSFKNFNIYSMRSDGSGIRQLTLGPASNSDPTVSADGRTIGYVSNRSGTRQLWKMDADGRNSVQLTSLPNDVMRAVLLPEGKEVLFSVFNAGKVSIWIMSADGGEPKQVVGSDVYLWAVSPKGDRLAFVTFDPNTKSKVTHIRSIGKDTDEKLLNISPENWLEWGVDGTSLYYNIVADNAANIWKISLDQQNAVPVTEFKDEQIYSFAWSPSGKTLACIRHNTTYDALILHFE